MVEGVWKLSDNINCIAWGGGGFKFLSKTVWTLGGALKQFGNQNWEEKGWGWVVPADLN